MTRESNIPLFLWVATALLAHLVWGGGVNRLSRAFGETLDIRRFAMSVRAHVRGAGEVEVALLEEKADPTDPEPPEATKPPDEEENTDEETDAPEVAKDEKKNDPKQTELAKPEPPKPEPPKPPPPKLEIKVEKKTETPTELPKVDTQKRIAVVQHVDDPSQEDNPNAEFIGDQANKVKQQTQARITSTDQNDPNPTPGGAHSGPTKNPGDSDESRVAQSEDRPGEPDQAPTPDDPGEEKPAKTASAAAPPPSNGAPTKAPGKEDGARAPRASNTPPDKGQTGRAAKPAVDAAPDTVNAPDGSFSVAEARAAQKAQKARKKRKKHLPPMRGASGANALLGLGALGTTQSGVNLNLSPQQAVAAIGKDRLRKEIKRDAERRKSAHRGSWQSLGIERWRSAIENYVPGVQPGNQTALNTARVPFASYLNAVHNRLHPVFADSFLASLDNLPASHPMNKPEIKTDLEIVLSQDDGRVVRMGVTHTSGVTAFDIAALESVMRAQPFGAPPKEIISPDGNVYFHWEFYRNPYYACSTYFAHPYILKNKPKTAPPSVAPPAPWRPKEAPPSEERHGRSEPDGRVLEKHASLR
jgi:hypothetical protein